MEYGQGVHRLCDTRSGCGPWVSNGNPNQIQQPPDEWVQDQRQWACQHGHPDQC